MVVTAALSTALSRPPVLLHIVPLNTNCSSNNIYNNHPANVLIEAGFVGQSKWKYCIEVLPFALNSTCNLTCTSSTKDYNSSNSSSNNNYIVDTISCEEYYRMYTNVIEYIFHLLCAGGGGFSSIGSTSSNDSTKDRRIIIIHNNGMYLCQSFQIAFCKIVQDIIGTRYISFHSSISKIPFSFIPSSNLHTNNNTNSNTNNSTTFLIVHITLQGAQCIIFSDKIVLEYTFQSCHYRIKNSNSSNSNNEDGTSTDNNDTKNANSTSTVLSMYDVQQMQSLWLINTDILHTTTTSNDNDDTDDTDSAIDFNPSTSLLITILKTIEICPIQLRVQAINSIVFSGTIIDTTFKEQIVYQLQQVLVQASEVQPKIATTKSKSKMNTTEATTTTTTTIDTTTIDSTTDDKVVVPSDSTTTSPSNKSPQPPRYSYIPINMKQLSSLGQYVGIVQMIPNTIRTDLLVWIGASTWAYYWHEYYNSTSTTSNSSSNYFNSNNSSSIDDISSKNKNQQNNNNNNNTNTIQQQEKQFKWITLQQPTIPLSNITSTTKE